MTDKFWWYVIVGSANAGVLFLRSRSDDLDWYHGLNAFAFLYCVIRAAMVSQG